MSVSGGGDGESSSKAKTAREVVIAVYVSFFEKSVYVSSVLTNHCLFCVAFSKLISLMALSPLFPGRTLWNDDVKQ